MLRLAAVLGTALSACGGGGGSAAIPTTSITPTTPTTPATPVPVTLLGVANSVTSQGTSGEALLAFRAAPAFDAVYPLEIDFTNQQSALYRTSSEKAGDANGAWLVDFSSGAIVSEATGTAAAVRLVRGK